MYQITLFIIVNVDLSFSVLSLGPEERIPMTLCHHARWAQQELITNLYHWHRMKWDIICYVKTCFVFQEVRSDNKEKAGLLSPFGIPMRK